MKREPVVAGQFYPASKQELKKQVQGFLEDKPDQERTILAMCPHAGYMFSGPVAGKTLGRARMEKDIILLGPNHSGAGASMAVWPDGQWEIPGESVYINEDLAGKICSLPGFQSDYTAHLREHSLEVILPFLNELNPGTRIVPISISQVTPERLLRAGENLAELLQENDTPATIVVSSDMSHFIPHEQAQKMDNLALEQIQALSPQGLLHTVMENRITMCGVLPMAVGLSCALRLGARQAEIVDYATSGDILGDKSQVVGYAGVLVT